MIDFNYTAPELLPLRIQEVLDAPNEPHRIGGVVYVPEGGGECEVISHYYYDDYDIHEFEFSCGHSYTIHDDMPYPHCPMCGAKVKAVKR